jgi:predicted nucleotidyltransferase
MNGSGTRIFGRSELRRALLVRLFSDPESELHPSRAARELGFTPQAVARELHRLEASGIATSVRIGRARLYRADRDSPLFAEVSGLVSKTIGIEALLRDALDGLDRIEEAALFGSYARGEVAPHSDLDVLVIGAPDRDALSERLASVEARVGREINVVTYTRREADRLLASGDSFISDVLDGPRVNLIGGKN